MRFPPSIYRILGTETCERFSYYGLRGILTLYAVHLGYSESTSVSIFAYSSALAYACPLVGGYVSDTYLGKYSTILYFGVVYCIGTFILSSTALFEWKWGLFVGLIFIGIGTGGIKPCVSAFGGDQLSANDAAAISSYFHYFYFCINVGSVCSLFITPIIRHYFGFGVAFGLPFFLLTFALGIFVSGRRHYKMQPPRGSVFATVYKVARCAWDNRRHRFNSEDDDEDDNDNDIDDDDDDNSDGAADYHHQQHLKRQHRRRRMKRSWLDAAVPMYERRVVDEVKALWRVLPIFACLITFWALFDQQGSSWTLQAKSMDLSVGRMTLQPEQLQVLNAILVLTLIPVFERVIYPWVNSRTSAFGPLNRMLTGMVWSAAAFVASAFVQIHIDRSPPHSVSVFYQVPQYVLITIGEILISITGLDFAYQQAPPSMKSIVQSLFLLTVALGDMITGILYNALVWLGRAEMLFVFAGLMIVNALAFARVRRRFAGSPEDESGYIASIDVDPINEKISDDGGGGGGGHDDDDDVDDDGEKRLLVVDDTTGYHHDSDMMLGGGGGGGRQYSGVQYWYTNCCCCCIINNHDHDNDNGTTYLLIIKQLGILRNVPSSAAYDIPCSQHSSSYECTPSRCCFNATPGPWSVLSCAALMLTSRMGNRCTRRMSPCITPKMTNRRGSTTC